MEHKRESSDPQSVLYYVAEGPANGRQLVAGKKPGIQHDQPIHIHRDLGGLRHLAHQVFSVHKDYLNDTGIITDPDDPYLGFSFELPYQVAMWDERVWQTDKLSYREQIDFLKEMQKCYISPNQRQH